MYDVLLRGGQILDGTGAPPTRGDIAITGTTIAAMGALPNAVAGQTIDATGRYVMPGMIDTHIHADAVADRPDVQLALLKQGVTTVICGQDGLSFAPASRHTIAEIARYFAAVNGPCPPALADGCTVADFLKHYDKSTALNVAYTVPAGTVRAEVMGYDAAPATRSQRAAMRKIVEDALADGAVGLSTGLEYVPGCYADIDELADLAAPVAAAGAPYVSHMRGYEAAAWRGLAEAVSIGTQADIAVHISHLHGPANMITAAVDTARSDGIDLTFDSYPYLKGSTIVSMVALPSEIQTGTPQDTLARLADPAVRRELSRTWFPSITDVLGRITLSYLNSDRWRWAEGMLLPDAAEKADMAPSELVCELVTATRLGAGCVFAQPPTNTDADVRTLLRHEAQMVGSDAILLGGRPHPRGWGAFARCLGRHTREHGDWTWGEAALHLAGHPARRFGLAGRGLLRPGAIADIAVVDPTTVTDRASYDDPRRVATGVDDVLVSGTAVLRDGTATAARPGRGLRFQSAE